ncbi:MAG: hypothetical protein NZM04_09570 [Methylacidiphilales bacterium]|nr:hypothetical protein [Candidatus Methylacidiphilales bacterium]
MPLPALAPRLSEWHTWPIQAIHGHPLQGGFACALLTTAAQHLAVGGKPLFIDQPQTLAACIAASQSLKQR